MHSPIESAPRSPVRLRAIARETVNVAVQASTPLAPAQSTSPLLSPAALRLSSSLSADAVAQIARTRRRLSESFAGKGGAPIVIVGPCSIHCEEAALDYARRLLLLREELAGKVEIVMRVYFEKPRTGLGWKGFLYDPDLDGSDDLARGLARSRALLVQIAEMGMPIATEILDPMVAEYFADCLSWVAIGARTSESQIHRQLASDLPCPVGFKNATSGDVMSALHSVRSAGAPHTFLGLDSYGVVSVRRSRGNEAAHLVLRGGTSGPNHSALHVQQVARLAREQGTSASLIVDCSHGNSGKDCRRQAEVVREVGKQMRQEASPVVGLMMESHLEEGSQSLSEPLRYGVSVTDPCLGFDETAALVKGLALGFED